MCQHAAIAYNATTQWCEDCGVTLSPTDTGMVQA